VNIGEQIIWLDEVNSTNDYASKLSAENISEGLVVAALFQTEGKGQRGNSWESNHNENLTFSAILFPKFLEVQKQFLLSKTVSLGVFDAISKIADNVSIKWPNDIYIGNGKVAGILIENSFSSRFLDKTIVGIGLNVNQVSFSDDLPNPTSLKIETGKHFELVHILNDLCKSLTIRYQQLIDKQLDKIATDYYQNLYHNNDYFQYSAEGRKFTARVVNVKESGELVLETTKGEILEFSFKEVSFCGE